MSYSGTSEEFSSGVICREREMATASEVRVEHVRMDIVQ